MTYAFCVLPSVFGLWSGNARGRSVVLRLLALQAIFGVGEWFWFGGARASSNPYLRISAWRPVWTVGIPLAWVAVLALTRPRRAAAIAPPTPRSG
jgi:hypothetical protein